MYQQGGYGAPQGSQMYGGGYGGAPPGGYGGRKSSLFVVQLCFVKFRVEVNCLLRTALCRRWL